MKKILSAIFAGALAIAPLSAASASAETYGDEMNITVFGDSIASGYGLGAKEYSYPQILGDYYRADVENYAVSGYDTEDVLEQIKSLTGAQRSELADSDVIILSVGANDMIQYSSVYLLNMADRINTLKSGYTAADIPEEPSFADVKRMIDTDAFKAYAGNPFNAITISDELQTLRTNLTAKVGDNNDVIYDKVIQQEIVPGIEAIVAEIKAVNPNGRIILQNVYNPLQFTKEFEAANFTGSYKTVMTLMKTTFNLVTKDFDQQLREIDGVEIADVLTDFSSYYMDDTTAAEYRFGWYFTNVQAADRDDMDVHPNQAGHLAIAAKMIEVIGKTKDDGGLLNLTMAQLDNKAEYPSIAMQAYNNAAGSYALGDVDGNGRIDASDAASVLVEYASVSTGKGSTLPENFQKAGDVDGNGKVDASDAASILVYYARVSTGEIMTFKQMLAK
ncbi:MAG: GDSL-type esterase/lipase family protein [Alistipes sp.]|nr:GDSL-type esterase/lipase family protein [Alistipes sp.]